MQVFVARQAIFNTKLNTVAYELLFRDGAENIFPSHIPLEAATSKLIVNQHLNIGFKTITDGKKALINFCQQGVLDDIPALLPAKEIIIEILEHTEPSEEVYQACKSLFEQGYRIALDDFQYDHGWKKFLPFTSLVKIDIQATPLNQIGPVITRLKQHKNINLLAEKVETQEEYQQAKSLGFDYFQGYFFSKPEMVSNKDIEINYQVILEIYHSVFSRQMDYDALASKFEQDMALTFKLLKFINSGKFELERKISSIKQALVYLGDNQSQKFIALVATAHLAKNKPRELVTSSVIRAKMCELINLHLGKQETGEAFLLGMFSMIDAILNKPMEDIILSLPLSDEIREALLGFKNPLFHLLELVKAYESGSWYNTQRRANVIQINQEVLPDIYAQAVGWSQQYQLPEE